MNTEQAYALGYKDGYTGSNHEPVIPDDLYKEFARGVRDGVDQLDTDRDKAAMYNGQ